MRLFDKKGIDTHRMKAITIVHTPARVNAPHNLWLTTKVRIASGISTKPNVNMIATIMVSFEVKLQYFHPEKIFNLLISLLIDPSFFPTTRTVRVFNQHSFFTFLVFLSILKPLIEFYFVSNLLLFSF